MPRASITIMRREIFVASFARRATKLLGSLKTLRAYCVPRLSILSGRAVNSLTPSRRKTLVQIVPFVIFIHGIDMIYPPAAWIVAGLLVFAALEVR